MSIDLSAKKRGTKRHNTGSFFWYWLLYEERGGIAIKTWREDDRTIIWMHGDKDPRDNDGYSVSKNEAIALGQFCLGLADKYHDLSLRGKKEISDKYYYELCTIGHWMIKSNGFRVL